MKGGVYRMLTLEQHKEKINELYKKQREDLI